MSLNTEVKLSKRERQIMDIIYSLGQATVEEIRSEMEEAPSNSAVRRLVSILVEKGHLQHKWQGPRYIYTSTMDRAEVGRQEAERLTKTFFKGSPVEAVATILDVTAADISDADLEALSKLIDKARQEGR